MTISGTQRMHQLVNAGPFSLRSIDGDEDNFGSKRPIINRRRDRLDGVLVDWIGEIVCWLTTALVLGQ